MSNPYASEPDGYASPWAQGTGFGTPPQRSAEPDPAPVPWPAAPAEPHAGTWPALADPAPRAWQADPAPSSWQAAPTYPDPQTAQGYQQAGYQGYPEPGPQAGQVQPYPFYDNQPLTEHPQSTLVLVLGIVSLVAFQPLGPIAWYLGAKARKEVRLNPGLYQPSGSLTAGWVLGIIASLLLVLVALFILLLIGLMAYAS